MSLLHKKLYRRKNGILDTVLVGIIITLVVGVLFIIIGNQIRQNLKGEDEIQTCRLSIVANDQLSNLQQGGESQISFKCGRRERVLELEDVEVNGRINDEKLKGILASEMKTCWYMTGNGKLDPFKSWAQAQSETYCLVCQDILFSQELQEQAQMQNYKLVGLNYWLLSKKVDAFDGSLYQYVAGTLPSDRLIELARQASSNPLTEIKLDERYSIVWRVEKYESGIPTDWEAITQILSGAAESEIPVTFLTLPSRDSQGMNRGSAVGAGKVTIATRSSGVTDRALDTNRLFQQVILVPEERMGLPFRYGDNTKEFCTRMIN